MTSAFDLYVVETELQLRGALAVHSERRQDAYFFTDNRKLYDYLNKTDVRIWLVEKKHNAGRIGKIRSMVHYVDSITDVIPSGGSCFLAVPRLDSLYNNALYSRLRKLYGEKLNVALLPDGVMSYYSGGMTDKFRKKLISYSRWMAWLTLGKHTTTLYDGDIMGGDEVQYVYHFGKIAPDVLAKCVPVSVFNDLGRSGKKSRNILIVGQNLLTLNKESKAFVESVRDKIAALAADISANQIYYARHPRATNCEFKVSGAMDIQSGYLCLEDVIGEYEITDVFSCSSSVLFNAKAMLGESVNCYTVGLDSCSHLNQEEREKLKSLYKRSGVQVKAL